MVNGNGPTPVRGETSSRNVMSQQLAMNTSNTVVIGRWQYHWIIPQHAIRRSACEASPGPVGSEVGHSSVDCGLHGAQPWLEWDSTIVFHADRPYDSNHLVGAGGTTYHKPLRFRCARHIHYSAKVRVIGVEYRRRVGLRALGVRLVTGHFRQGKRQCTVYRDCFRSSVQLELDEMEGVRMTADARPFWLQPYANMA